MIGKDNITLPRKVAEHLTKMLEECPLIPNADWSERDCVALNALRKALAAEQPKPEALQAAESLEQAIQFYSAGLENSDNHMTLLAFAAAKLRRLHAENEQLRELLTEAKNLAWAFGADSLRDRINAALQREDRA